MNARRARAAAVILLGATLRASSLFGSSTAMTSSTGDPDRALGSAFPAAPETFPAPRNDASAAAALETIRQKFNLPAVGGAVVDDSGVKVAAAVGIRSQGEAVAVALGDGWHLGSDSKAMTATMIASLVEHGEMAWETTLSDVFPEMHLPPGTGAITLLELLSHRAGIPANADWKALSVSGSLPEQRHAAVAALSSTELLAKPGAGFMYSNWGYVAAAAMAEKLTGKSYEALMRLRLFETLGMRSAGFGSPGTSGKLDAPWGHSPAGSPSQKDNPLVLAPAGGVHCSLGDWGRFISDQLRGAEGRPALLRPESYARLHTPPFGGNYALGWAVLERPWAGGRVLFHAGSNTRNVAVVWLAPARGFAMLVVCNQGGSEKACDEAVGRLIALHSAETSVP